VAEFRKSHVGLFNYIFGRGTLLLLSRHTCVSRHTGWEALDYAIEHGED